MRPDSCLSGDLRTVYAKDMDVPNVSVFYAQNVFKYTDNSRETGVIARTGKTPETRISQRSEGKIREAARDFLDPRLRSNVLKPGV